MRKMIFVAIALAASSAAADPFKAGSVRYVSCDGDDANDGLTLATPWKSLRRLNSGLPPGGVALLRRGDVFYGQLRVPSGLSQCRPTVIGAYGEGEPPEISAYKIAKGDESVWEHVGENLWRIDLADKTAFYGNSSTSDGNVGFLKIDGVIQGRKAFLSYRKIPAEPWEFVDDHRYLTVWCATNPASAAKDIRFAPKMDLVWCGSNVTIQNVLMRGTGAHGVSATNPSHLRMVDCGFAEIGGSHLEQNPRSGGTRYGNAVQLWRGASDVCISNCVFSEVYDVAFTMQGDNPPRGWENVQVVGCVMSNCTQNFEIWTMQCANGVGYKKCTFEGNVCIGTSRGWGWDVRPDRRNGVPLLIYKMDTDVCDIAVRGNVFRDFRGALIGRGRLGKLPEGYRIEGNTVFMSYDTPLCSDPSDDPASIARESIIRRDNSFTVCDKSVPQD